MEIDYFDNKDFSLIEEINKTGRRYKALVILYGPADYGKTGILKQFIHKKTGNRQKTTGDVRCVFHANSQGFCVCTGGDNRKIVEMNCATFDRVAASMGSPLICISAARIGNGSSSVADVFDYYSRKIRDDCYITLWINIKELLATASRLAGVSGYDKSKDLKHQAIYGRSIDNLTDKACELLDKQIQEIEKL